MIGEIGDGVTVKPAALRVLAAVSVISRRFPSAAI